jgi:protein ImuA
MEHAGHNAALSDLRRRIVALDRSARARRPALAFEVEAVDSHLPWGGLPLGTLHEFAEGGLEAEHVAAATLFIGGCLARLKGSVLWCLRGRDLFAPALASVGLHPDRVIYVETWKDGEVLPAMEEALRHGGLAGVVGEVAHLSLVASRRLQLAAESSGVPAFALRRWRNDAERASASEPNAAFTRWRIAPAPSSPPPVPGLARARWRVDLLRCRGAEPHSWILEACDAKGRLAFPADVSDRSDREVVPAATQDGGGRPLPFAADRDGGPRRVAAARRRSG